MVGNPLTLTPSTTDTPAFGVSTNTPPVQEFTDKPALNLPKPVPKRPTLIPTIYTLAREASDASMKS